MIKNTIICARVLAATGFLTLLGATDGFGAAYTPGTVAIKPLNFNVSTLVNGYNDSDSGFNAPGGRHTRMDAFRSSLSLGFNAGDRNGWAYGAEIALMIPWDMEVLVRAGYAHERPIARFRIGSRAFDFDPRSSFHGSIGARKYFALEDSPWVPYVGATGGFVIQGKTCSDVYDVGGGLVPPQTFIGKFTLLDRKTLGTFEVHVGTDYKISDLWVMSLSAAARYIQSGGSKSFPTSGPTINGNVDYSDNKQRWYFPFTLSLKLTF